MSAIDELNDSMVIDVTGGSMVTKEAEDGVTIDATGSELKTKVVNKSVQINPPSRHKFVKQEPKRTPESAGGKKIIASGGKKSNPPTRKVVTQSAIPVQPEKEIQEVHVSPMDDMLGINNPNSMLSKWVESHDQEAREWIAEKEEEKAVLELEDGEETSGSIGNDEFEVVEDRRTLVEDDDLILDLTSKKEEENMDEEERIDELIDTEDLEFDTSIDEVEEPIKEELDPENEADEEEVEVDVSSDIDNGDSGSAGIGEVEEESYTLEDLDIEESETEATPVVIVEDSEDEESTAEDSDDSEVLKNLQKMVTDKIKPISTQLDLSSYTIIKKPVSNINNILADASSRVVKWVLFNQQAIVKMKDFTGSELEKLREYSENSRDVNSLNRRYKMIYDHIVSPKPQSFETWLKCTPYSDLEHYFFAIYIANYKGANFLPVDCRNDKCKNTWVTEDINVMDMVKFNKQEDRDKFEEIYKSEATAATGKGLYCTQVVALSPKIAIAFKEPSLYSVIESMLIDDKTRTTYSSIVDYIPYIDEVYIIDSETHQLAPVGYKRFTDNATRDIRSKIQKYASIFSVLSADEFGPVKAYVRALSERNDGVKYVFPELTCPKCKSTIKEEETSAEALVFTRYQLGSLTSTLLS